MPTYSYRCQNCEHCFDLFQKITAEPETECPQCRQHALKRLIGGGAGIIFKGSGFYITDYRSKNYQERARAESKSSATSDSSVTGDKSKSSDSGKTANSTTSSSSNTSTTASSSKTEPKKTA